MGIFSLTCLDFGKMLWTREHINATTLLNRLGIKNRNFHSPAEFDYWTIHDQSMLVKLIQIRNKTQYKQNATLQLALNQLKMQN